VASERGTYAQQSRRSRSDAPQFLIEVPELGGPRFWRNTVTRFRVLNNTALSAGPPACTPWP